MNLYRKGRELLSSINTLLDGEFDNKQSGADISWLQGLQLKLEKKKSFVVPKTVRCARPFRFGWVISTRRDTLFSVEVCFLLLG